MELEILHNYDGDKKRVLDTATEVGRKETEASIRKMLKQGTAIFLERGKKTFRVTGFDGVKNRLLVRVERRGKESVAAKPDRGRKTAVPPRAGG
jgi:hypothetical protein